MWKSFRIAVAVLLTGVAGQLPVRAEGTDGAKDVPQLLRDLASDTRQVRVEAEQALLKRGTELLDELPPPDLIRSPSARDAVERIRRELEEKAARDSTEPSSIRLDGTKTLAAWADEIARQSGNRVHVPPRQAGKSVTLGLAPLPFWTALHRAGWKLEYEKSGGLPDLLPAPPPSEPSLPADRRGLFRVEGRASRKADVVQVQVEFVGEPRIRPLYATFADADISLSGQETESRPVSADARREVPLSGRGPGSVTIPLIFPKGDEARLTGQFVVKTAARPLPLAFEGLHRNERIARRRGGVTVTHLRTRAADGEIGIRISVVYDHGGPEFESHRLWLYHNEAWLETLDGERLSAAPQIESLEESNGALAFEYRFSGITRPLDRVRFVYVVPSLIVDVPVVFRIDDVPIRNAPAN